MKKIFHVEDALLKRGKINEVIAVEFLLYIINVRENMIFLEFLGVKFHSKRGTITRITPISMIFLRVNYPP